MGNNVKVIGVDMIKFTKPGTQEPYELMASKAILGAIKDAGIDYKEIKQAYASYVYGDSTSGQAALYKVGMTGIPVFNVYNNCSSGSTAIFLARQAVQSGVVECTLAFGFEEMKPGALADGTRLEKIEEYRNMFANPYVAASHGMVDDVIDPRDTRKVLKQSLEMLRTKKETRPKKKHGNIPL